MQPHLRGAEVIEVFVAGIGLRGPGLADWASAVPILAGAAPLGDAVPALPPPALLAPNERRRAGTVVRLALAVAAEASGAAGIAPGAIRGVFASGNGDGAVLTSIIAAISGADPVVSPTQFHNSVHNAPAGYWSIGARSTRPTSSLGAHDASFPAGLLKAAAEARAEGEPVLLCAYDAPFPQPLAERRPTVGMFGVALVLTPRRSALPRLRLRWREAGAASVPLHPGLRALHAGNPAARCLPLLEALARGGPAALSVGWLDGSLEVEVEPCSGAPASPR